MRHMRFCLFASVFLLTANAWAQEFRATLNGTVRDAQGAMVPGVKITVTQVQTGSASNTVSGSAGQYTIPLLPPGVYNINAEAAGFKTYRREGVQLSTNERVTVDIGLELGTVTESVIVTGEAPILTTATASVGQPLTADRLEDLPSAGRAPLSLVRLAFGVTGGTTLQRPFDSGNTVSYSMGGGQNQSNELLLDGGPNMSRNRRSSYNPPLDSVTEVKAEVFQSDAAYGDTSGGTISLATKSGTNRFHGSTSWFNQTSKLAATQFFTNRAGGKKTTTLYNQYGATAGAPLIVPKLFNGKDRVFWYFGYEGVKHTVPQPTILTLPTPDERRGDFSALLALASSYQIYDPRTGVAEGSRRRRQPFPNNIIPADRLNPIALNYLKFYPAPNQAGLADGRNNYFTPMKRHDDYFSLLSRLDFNISNDHKFFWRLYRAYRTEYIRNRFDNIATGEIRPRDTEGMLFDDVYTFSATTLLNTRLSWNRFRDAERRQSDGYDFTQLGFPASLRARSQHAVLPVLSFSDGVFGVGGTGDNAGAGFVTPYDLFQLFTTMNQFVGSHNLKFGAEVRMGRESSVNYQYSSGLYTFGTEWVRGPLDNSTSASLGQSFASFLLGLPTAGQFDVVGARTNQSWYTAIFLQDDWRISQRLTLNLGLRYEKSTGTVERHNRALAGFDFTSPNQVTAAARAAYAASPISEVPAGQFNPVGGPIFAGPQRRNVYTTDSNAFSPRFGFAWTPQLLGAKATIRGGFGIFFDPTVPDSVYQPGFSQSTPLVPTQDGYLTSYATLSNPFRDGILFPPGASGGINTYLGQSITYCNPQLAIPYTMRWTLTAQRQLRPSLVIEAGYMGSRALYLPLSRALNYTPARFLSTSPARDNTVINRLTANVANPFQGLLPGTTLNGSAVSVAQLMVAVPQLTGLTVSSANEGFSDYHALQVRVEQRLWAGLRFLLSASISRMMEATGRLNTSDPSPYRTIATEDRPYRVVISGNYDLPFGRGKPLAGGVAPWLNHLVGGWALAGTFTGEAQAALSWGNVIYYGGNLHYQARNIDAAFDTTRFNRDSRQQLANNVRTFPQRFSNLRPDRREHFEAGLIKNLMVAEGVRVQLRGEAFNLMNRAQFGGPDLSPTSSSFGKITSQANDPRLIQLGLRIAW